MREREARRVEELPSQAEIALHAVDGVARDRKLDRREVDANLVRSSSLQSHTQQREQSLKVSC